MSVNLKDELFKAIACKDKEGLENLLVNHKVHPNARNDRDLSPAVVFAVKKKNLHAMKLLLKHGASPNDIDRNGMNAVLFASDLGYLKYLKILKKSKANFEAKDKHLVTALMLSAQWDHAECLQFILNCCERSIVDCKDIKGETALMYASRHGRNTSVHHLINMNAEKNAVCLKGYSALMHALRSSEIQTADLLLSKGADVNIVGNDGKTALTLAFQNCLNDYRIVISILEKGADVNLSKFDQGQLHEMVARGEHKIIRLMIMNGCPPLDRMCIESCFKFNFSSLLISPLCVAVLLEHDDIAKYFIVNHFLTNFDLSGDIILLAQKLPEQGQHLSILLNHLPSHYPYSLYTQCFVKLCSILNPGSPQSKAARERKLSSWRLPNATQTELLFQGKFSRLCTSSWHCINLEKDQEVERCTCNDCYSKEFPGCKVI